MTWTHEDAINNAIELLRNGWIKEDYKFFNSFSGETSYCAVGALRESSEQHRLIYKVLDKVCQKATGYPIIFYNDRKAETVEDIIVLYEKVRAEVGSDGMLPDYKEVVENA